MGENGLEGARTFLAGDRCNVVHPAGTLGYALPTLDEVEILPLTAALQHPNIAITERGAGGNALILAPQKRAFRLRVNIGSNARNNLVVVGRDSQAHTELELLGTDSTVIIGEHAEWPALFHARISSARAFLFWGGRSKSNGVRLSLEGDESSVIVGEDCMFAPGTEIRTSDLHSIVQLDDDTWLNPPENVLIEPHVWLGQGALVLKGTRVGLGSIVAARAVVTRDVPRLSIAGGIPARVIKTGVSWDTRTRPRQGTLHALRAKYGDMLP
jgi:hypothetical protein